MKKLKNHLGGDLILVAHLQDHKYPALQRIEELLNLNPRYCTDRYVGFINGSWK